MNHKEVAERLASCGLTPDTLGAVILELIRIPAMMNRQQNPAPDSSWQIGFGDALGFLEHEAGKVSAELVSIDLPGNPYRPGSLEWSCWNDGYRSCANSPRSSSELPSIQP